MMNYEQVRNCSVHVPDYILRDARRDATTRLLHVASMGNYYNITTHKAVRDNQLSEYILIYCYGGKGYYTTDTSSVDIFPGMFFTVPANTAHQYGNTPGDSWSIVWVHVAGTQAREVFDRLHPLQGDLPHPQSGVLTIFKELIQPILVSWSPANVRLTNHILWHFLGLFTKQECVGLPADHSESETVSDQIIHYFEQNLASPHSLASLESLTGLSASHVSACFKAETGQSPIDYLIRMRLLEAARLLETTTQRVGSIGETVGYNDPKFFSKSFRRIMGISPREYRKKFHAV